MKFFILIILMIMITSCRRANYETIVEAVQQGDVATVKDYIFDGGDVNFIDKKKGFTLLMHAALGGHHTIVKILLDNNANKNIKTAKDKVTALHLSLNSSNYKTVKLLIDKTNANSPVANGNTPLILAVKGSDYNIVKLILQNGGDVNSVSKNNETALISLSTSFHPNIDILKLLIAKKIKINIQKKNTKRTALIYAVMSGKVEVIKILLVSNASPNLLDYKQLTALDYALKKNNEKDGVDYNLQNKNYKIKIIKLLKKYGAKTAVELGKAKKISPVTSPDSSNKRIKKLKANSSNNKNSLYVSPI